MHLVERLDDGLLFVLQAPLTLEAFTRPCTFVAEALIRWPSMEEMCRAGWPW